MSPSNFERATFDRSARGSRQRCSALEDERFKTPTATSRLRKSGDKSPHSKFSPYTRLGIFSFALALIFTATSAFAADALQAIQERGVLKWGADAEGGAPYVFPDPQKPEQLIGFEAELATALAAKLGVKAEMVQNQWDQLTPALLRGNFDIILNGLELTPENQQRIARRAPNAFDHAVEATRGEYETDRLREREQRLDFTHSVFHSGLRIAVRDDGGDAGLGALDILLSWDVLRLVAALAALTVVVGHLLWWCERGANDHSFPRD